MGLINTESSVFLTAPIIEFASTAIGMTGTGRPQDP
jgi:hypothetical protein